jgi:hypothetical protein
MASVTAIAEWPPSIQEVAGMTRTLIALLVAVVAGGLAPGIAHGQETPFPMIIWDGSPKIIDSDGYLVGPVPISTVGLPYAVSMSRDGRSLLYMNHSLDFYLHDMETDSNAYLFHSDWNRALDWLPGSSTQFITCLNGEDYYLYDLEVGPPRIWQSRDGFQYRSCGELHFDAAGTRALFETNHVAGGGQALFVGDVCDTDTTHHLCNVRVVSEPGLGSSSWENVAFRAALSPDGRTAAYFVRRNWSNYWLMAQNLETGVETPLENWAGADTPHMDVWGFHQNRYLVATGPSQATPGQVALFVCDTESGSCREAYVATNFVRPVILDVIAPSILSVAPNPSELFPPTHKMVPVLVSVAASDNLDAAPSCRITTVTSSEPPWNPEEPDWVITGDLTVDLRAVRRGTGPGRTYTIEIRCTDASGNTATASTTVLVPHDRGR